MSQTSAPGGRRTGTHGRMGVAVAIAAMIALCGMSAYAVAKQYLMPHLTLWQSHTLTIFAGTAVAAVAAWLTVRSARALRDRLAAENAARQDTETGIKALQQQMEFILGATKTGLDIIDSDYNVRYIDPAWQKVYGDPAGRKCYEYFMGRDAACPGCGIRQALETKQVTVTEEVLVKEGNRPIQVTTMPFQDGKGEWLVAEANVDIADRRRAEEALRAGEEQLRITLASIGDGVIATDAARRVTRLNKVAEALTGWTSGEAAGRAVAEVLVLIHEQTRLPLQDPAQEAIATGRVALMANHALLVARDGTERPVADSAAPIRDAAGGIVGAVVVFRDVTEERRRRKEKDQLLHDLGERVKELDCLCDLGRLLHEPGVSLEDVLAGAVRLLPPAFQYPDTTSARISCEGRAWDAGEHPWDDRAARLAADILVHGERAGWVGVCRSGAEPEADERPFLEEEQMLVDAVAERLGRVVEHERAERALGESEERFRVIFENAADGILVADARGERFGACNPAMGRMLGYRPEEMPGLGVADIHPAEDLPRVRDHFEKQIRKEIALARELPVKRKDGSVLYADVCAFPITLQGEKHLVGFFRDVTERKRADEALRQSQVFLQTVVDSIAGSTIVIDRDYRIVLANRAARGLAGGRDPVAAGMKCYQLSHRRNTPCEGASDPCPFKQVLETKNPVTATHVHYDSEGRERFVEVTAAPLFNREGAVVQVVESCQDITDRKRHEQQLAHQATHDSLTGLPTRRLFEEALARAIARARRGTPSALLLLDVDHFKTVNDTLGHAAGDEVLVQISRLLTEQFRAEDVVARLGGDEFVVLLEGMAADPARAVAERVCGTVAGFAFVPDRSLRPTISIGMVEIDGRDDMLPLFSRADAAMYQAKEQGRNRVVVRPQGAARPEATSLDAGRNA